MKRYLLALVSVLFLCVGTAQAEPISIPKAVDVVVGTTATLITKPQGKTVVVFKCTKGSFLYEAGDNVSAFPTDPTATTLTAGEGTGVGSWPVTETDGYVFVYAPAEFTVKGAAADSKLYFYWM